MSAKETKSDRRIIGFEVNGAPTATKNILQWDNSNKRFNWIEDVSKYVKGDESINTNSVLLTSGLGVKGTWVELIDPTTFFTNYTLTIVHDSDTISDYFIDIGVGVAGSEIVKIPDIIYHIDLVGQSNISIPYPLKAAIDRGSRVAARVLSDSGNADELEISCILQGTIP